MVEAEAPEAAEPVSESEVSLDKARPGSVFKSSKGSIAEKNEDGWSYHLTGDNTSYNARELLKMCSEWMLLYEPPRVFKVGDWIRTAEEMKQLPWFTVLVDHSRYSGTKNEEWQRREHGGVDSFTPTPRSEWRIVFLPEEYGK